MVDQVMVIFAGTDGFLDQVPVEKVSEWESGFLAFVHDQKSDLVKTINDAGKLDDDAKEQLVAALNEYNKSHSAPSAD